MTLTRKDAGATALTILVVLTYAAVHEGWNVWLVGDSVRWATGAILVLGMLSCGLGTPGRDALSIVAGILGIGALVLALLALVTASLTPLSLLVLDVVLLWVLSTFRHLRHAPHAPLPV